MLTYFFRLGALFFFSAATFGFLYFKLKYSRGSLVRLWGIRVSHVLGFLGVLMHRLWIGAFNEFSLLAFSALLVSVIGFELSERFLRELRYPEKDS